MMSGNPDVFTIMKKKILIALVAIIIIIIGVLYIKFLMATSRMQELSADLEKRIVEWEKKEYKRPPLFGPAIQGNAADFYQQAESQMVELMKDSEVWIQWADYVGHYKPLSTTGISYYEKAKPIIALIKNGVNTEFYKSLIDIRDYSNNIPRLMPNIMSIPNIANAMVVQGRELEDNNHFPEALELYFTILRYGDDCIGDGFLLVSACMGLATSDIGYNEIQRLLLSNKLSEQELNKLIDYLNTLFSYEPSSEHSYETEALSMSSMLKSYIAKKESFPPVSWLKTILWVQVWDKTIPLQKEKGRITTLPYYKAKDESEKLQKRIKEFWNPNLRTTFLDTIIFSGWHHYRAHRRGLYILCALEIYKAKHQKYPEKLSDLAPEIIPDVPLDPFSDQSFIYKVQPGNTIMLYSVGDNLKDDNGDEKRYNDIVIAPLKKW
jgi:hypothetical protein